MFPNIIWHNMYQMTLHQKPTVNCRVEMEALSFMEARAFIKIRD